jgi:hypothetical protein
MAIFADLSSEVTALITAWLEVRVLPVLDSDPALTAG